MAQDINKLLESLSPLEIKILPYLNLTIEEIKQKTQLDNTSVLRALKFLENKSILKVETAKKKIIELGINGIYYKKNHLPERKLLLLLEQSNHIQIEEAKKLSKLSDNEFKVSLGVLKSKALIEIKNEKVSLTAKKEELTKKTLEEKLIEALPLEFDSLQPEQLYAFQVLQKRKDIIQIEEKTIVSFKLTELGKQIAGREIKLDLIEELTPEIIKNWKKNKKFRSYDITSPVPAIYGGKKHFVSQAGEYARQIWRDLGFKEMTGPKVETSFWVFDALFTPQDHPAREMQDTFFIKNIPGSLPKDKALVKKVKEAHEKGLAGSKGWRYEWTEEEASKILLRTHTTAISARTLAKLDKKELPAKFFAIGRCFRNETVDWSHGFEFNQTEGIVVDKNANFRNLLGYLKEFFTKMGYEKILFRPSFFAYTEPSVEIAVWHPEKKVWLELGGAGIFRPEVVIPFFGEYIPVLAWGPGFDRSIMMNYNINDLRQVYSNDIEMLRKIKPWLK
ncbi:phenylalanine--tRNA ligase subunit alpha [Candidatus Pacearchaeota archaeon]|nr:phenylalanine--tRNA ligase subunit alpha [Candidatus Pacearchaeota archaeon]